MYKRGNKYDVYYLEGNKKANAIDFLLSDKKSNECIVAGFFKSIEYILCNGVSSLPRKQFKKWPIESETFWELKKNKHRISFFKYTINGKKILIMTHFTKKQLVETKQYNKAIKLKREFDANPIWED